MSTVRHVAHAVASTGLSTPARGRLTSRTRGAQLSR
jgi:hypothetical protein